jgi:hypothetical protein
MLSLTQKTQPFEKEKFNNSLTPFKNSLTDSKMVIPLVSEKLIPKTNGTNENSLFTSTTLDK